VSQGNTAITASDLQQNEAGKGELLFRMIRAGRSFSGREKHCSFLNYGDRRFADVSAVAGLDYPDDGRAAAVTDWDQDGDLDLWISNRTGPQIRFLRNEFPSAGSFLQLRLEGRQSNRDAIGARVELVRSGQSDRKLIKTIRAGDGFLAQSSKTIHFGLGANDQIERVDVRWPSGLSETFTGVSPNGRWRIVEGTGAASPDANSRPTPTLARTTLPNLGTTDQAHIRVSDDLPMPQMSYRTFEGESVTVNNKNSAAVLLNLWASWCRPCAIELRDFADHQEQLRAAGVEVIALSVDRLQADAAPAGADQRLLEQIAFPFRAGTASVATVDKLQFMHDFLVARHRSLPLPSSFLIDRGGRLLAVYTGPVSVEQVLGDMQMLPAVDPSRRTAALPFAGTWDAAARKYKLANIAGHLVTSGYAADAAEYLDRNKLALSRRPQYFHLLSETGQLLADEGLPHEGLRFLRAAIEARPDSAPGHVNVGVILDTMGLTRDAIAKYQDAARLDPQNALAHAKLGQAFTVIGEQRQALKHLQRALQLDAGNLNAANNLVWILATHPDPTIRDAPRALEVVAASFKDLNDSEPALLDTVAAAYAAAGQFDRAQDLAAKGKAAALSTGNQRLADEIGKREKLYVQGIPYVE